MYLMEVSLLQFVINIFNHYGYIVLFISLMLELIAVPLPGEALMTYCGYVIYLKQMNWFISIVIAACGAALGITLSYLIGRLLGVSFFEKYGYYVHLDRKRLNTVSTWFKRYGNKLLIIAFFIPGVRHITGYFSGITEIPYKKFAGKAYAGALIWTATFISLGKALGANWEKYHALMTKYMIIGSLGIAVVLVALYLYRSAKERVLDFIIKSMESSLKTFHSLGRLKAVVGVTTLLFLVLSALVIGIIQDYLAHEFKDFDEIARYLVRQIFVEDYWINIMKAFKELSNLFVLASVAGFSIIWIIMKGTERTHELKYVLISVLGAFTLEILLRYIFRRVGPQGTAYTFPSAESLLSVVFYGFLTYLIGRHNKKIWVNSILTSFFFFVCTCVGISIVYYNLQYPSDIVAGYEFGGLWLTLLIIHMEVYRALLRSH